MMIPISFHKLMSLAQKASRAYRRQLLIEHKPAQPSYFLLKHQAYLYSCLAIKTESHIVPIQFPPLAYFSNKLEIALLNPSYSASRVSFKPGSSKLDSPFQTTLVCLSLRGSSLTVPN